MSKNKIDFKYVGIVGARKQLSSLGAFFLVVFGVPFAILSLGEKGVFPQWLFWFFLGGMFLGGILLLGGAFAIDANRD
jgi:uncharacterized membrane protein (DUF106 family)